MPPEYELPYGWTVLTGKERHKIPENTSFMDSWPEFLKFGKVGGEALAQIYAGFPEFQTYAVDREGRLAGIVNAAPVSWDGSLSALPSGFDGLCYRIAEEMRQGTGKKVLAGLAISVADSHRQTGLASAMIQRLKRLATQHQMGGLIVPLRPTKKKAYPLSPIERYGFWRTKNGDHFDPWVRLHERHGAQLLRADAEGMRVESRLSHWEKWTGLSFFESGWYIIPEGLAPLKVDMDKDHGVYREGSLWVSYPS